MAKARTKASVRDRAVAAFEKQMGKVNSLNFLKVYKSRSKKQITVADKHFGNSLTWSYEGGNLKRLSPAQAAGTKGLSACISDL